MSKTFTLHPAYFNSTTIFEGIEEGLLLQSIG